MENLLKELHDIICQLEGSPASKRKKQLVKLRILNECKDCVGAWVLQITGTGVGTLSETGYTPNPIFAYPTLLNKHSEGEEG